MTEATREGYARLPEDLLRDLLQGADAIVDAVSSMLSPAIERREELRSALDDLGLIRRMSPTPASTICGVDGGFAVERTAAVDLLLSVGVGVEGLSDSTTAWSSPQYEWWARADSHDVENERLCRGVMVAQELAIISNAPHDLKILDGSHLTLVIQLNSSITSFSQAVREEVRRVWDRLGVVDALHRTCRDASIVAMPKYDSSRVVVEMLQRTTGETLAGDDKHVLSLLLEPGEYIVPQQVPEEPWMLLHFDARTKQDQPVVDGLTKAIEPLVDRDIDFTYFKPDELSPAFRIETKRSVTDTMLNEMLSTIAGQITGPFVREPYPQYLADVMAKSVGLGLSAVMTAVQLALSATGRPELAEFLVRSYRTEGV